jgi:hypothetical protein
VRRARRIVTPIVVLLLVYGGVLCAPQPLFAWSVTAENLTLYADRPFASGAGTRVLELAHAKLAASPLYAGEHHNIFVCSAPWRRVLLFNHNYRVGGVSYPWLTGNVFLRDARIEDNRLLDSRGQPVSADRSLDYFVAHEVTHAMTGRVLGALDYGRLPEWIREGYADYVGKGRAFDYDTATHLYRDRAPSMDRWQSGLYLRYHLLVAYELDKQHWTLPRLLASRLEQAAAEREIEATIR